MRISPRRPGYAVMAVAMAATATLIAACGSSGSTHGRASDANGKVTASANFGSSPTVTIPKAHATSDLQVKTIVKGTGPAFAANSFALANLAIYDWHGTVNHLLDSTFAASSMPQMIPSTIGLRGLATALKNATMGSRILAVVPPKYGYGAQGDPSIGVSAGDTTVWVIDLIKDYSSTASAVGKQVSSGGGALPTVTNPKGSQPVIGIPKHSPPAKLISTTLIAGTGPKIANGQTVIAQYVGVNWRTGKTFSTSWPSSTQPTGAMFDFKLGGQLIAGWNKALPGVRVGSRVMLVVPPADGYGKKGNAQAGIKGTDTLVFVIDILDVQH